MTLRFIPLARRELLNAATYYDDIRAGLGDRLLDHVGRALRDIQDFPEAQPLIDMKHRRCLTRTFPYALIYRIESGTIWIIAVAHTSRRPGFWRRRRLGGSESS